MDRQNLIARFVTLANEIGVHSPEVANTILRIVKGEEDVPYAWLVRWALPGHEWDNNPTTPERMVGHALTLISCGGWQKKLPFIIPERGRYQAIWVNQVEPLNKGDLEDAKQARALGLDVNVQPKYASPPFGQVATREEFEAVVKAARPSWVDESPRGPVVISHEPGCDEEGHPIDLPVYGEEILQGPGFTIAGVPEEWVGAYSRLTAFTKDGATEFKASFSNGGGGPVHMGEVPMDAEWRIPRQLVEKLLGLTQDALQLFKEEEAAREATQKEAERKRLAAKFGVE